MWGVIYIYLYLYIGVVLISSSIIYSIIVMYIYMYVCIYSIIIMIRGPHNSAPPSFLSFAFETRRDNRQRLRDSPISVTNSK